MTQVSQRVNGRPSSPVTVGAGDIQEVPGGGIQLVGLIHGEHEAPLADLAALTGEQWATSSLCSELRRHLKDTTHAPGPAGAMLGEAVIHGEGVATLRARM